MGRVSSSKQPTGLRTLGVWAAIWGVICAAATSSLGAFLGFVAGLGAVLVALPLVVLGQTQFAPLALAGAIVLFICRGVYLILTDFLRNGFAGHDYSRALQGVHNVGICAALLVSFASVQQLMA